MYLFRYEFSSAYQTGPETHLFPSKDTGLSVRMAKYRRSGRGGGPPRPPSIRSSMKERRDLRDLDKELEMEENQTGSSLSALRTVWQIKGMMSTNAPSDSQSPLVFLLSV